MTQHASLGKIFLAIFLSALVLSGCPKAKQTPLDETKKEASEPAQIPQKTEPPSKPSSVPSAAPAETQTTSKTTPVAPEPGQHPIAGGSALLNPAVPKDAQMIQTRLSELGFYKGQIDGIWGKGSRAALKTFKEKNALDNPDRWDEETQVLLFSETGQATQPSGDKIQESIGSGEVLLNPDVEKDARIIQKRLAASGLYKGPIDGIWGKGSRAALKTFKEKNGLASPDKWDKETQMLLFKK